MNPLQRLLLLESLLARLVCPVPLLCSVLIRFVEAKLSLLSGLLSAVGPPDRVLGSVKCAIGTALCGAAVDGDDTEFIPVLSDMEGSTRLVRME